MKKTYNDETKKGVSILGDFERKFIDSNVHKFPDWITDYHLTYLTILWSISILIFSYLATFNIQWLWLVSLSIFLQWFTDSFDGSLGRYRKAGRIKWGYYMDHFLDYVFLASIIIGYAFIFPEHVYIHFFTFLIFVGFMVNSFLSFAATNEFKIEHLGIGPTEVRLIFILTNTALILVGKTYLGGLAPYILIASFLGLLYVVYQTQKKLWQLDMKNKNKSK